MLRFGTAKEVYLDNEIIGEIWGTEFGFQCQLRTSALRLAPSGGLSMNGTGETKREAVLMALGNALTQANILISESERIFNKL